MEWIAESRVEGALKNHWNAVAAIAAPRMENFVPLERLDYLRGLSTKQLQEGLATMKTRLEREDIALEERARAL